MGFESQVNERGTCNHPLSETQQPNNRVKSQIRARVEHVFGAWVMEMGGKVGRSMGLARAKTTLGLKNLTCNFLRYRFWEMKGA